MATPATPTPTKQSWWKRALNEVGKIIGVIEKDAPKVEAIAIPALQAAFPQFAVLIGGFGAAAQKILGYIVNVQAVGAAAAVQPTGAQRLDSVLADAGPLVDQWIQSAFPGHASIPADKVKGLIQAMHDVLETVDPEAKTAA